MKNHGRSFFILFLALVSCGKGPKPEEMLGVSEQNISAVVEEIQYEQNGSTISLKAPFSGFLRLIPDFDGGNCETSAEIRFLGTFDPENTKTWSIQGAKAYSVEVSGAKFKISTCLSSGASFVVIRTLNKDGVAGLNPPQFSLNLSPSLVQTIGWGHPSYPQPGFRMLNSAPVMTRYVSNPVLSLTRFTAGDSGGKEIISNTQPAMSLSTGFIPILQKVDP